MKYSLLTLTLLTSFAFADFVNPLPPTAKALDNGGIKNSLDAYNDGIGVAVVDNKYATELNQQNALKDLVFKYGEKAKISGSSVVDYVSIAPESTTEEKTIAQEFKSLAGTGPIDGTACDDGNSNSFGETWLNGVCQGGKVNGTSCDDGNSNSFGETWLNGICQGGITGTLAGNGLIYDNCEGGSRNLANASSYCVSKGMRLPTLSETRSSNPTNGIPSCSSGWTWTSTPYNTTYYVWNGTSKLNIHYNNSSGVRCVK